MMGENMAIEIKSDKQSERVQKLSVVRRFLAQFLATTVENLLLFDMGLIHAFPLIIIAALTGHKNAHNLNETLSLTAVQASYLGSIGYISEPLGAILSAMITDALGRRTSMVITNIPLVIGWFMMFYATSLSEIFIANILLGFGAGLMESPIIVYVGEICDPTFRGIMIAYTHVGYTLGMLLVSLLNTFIPWRIVGLVCTFVPIVTAITLFFVPETPLWLLSKNRTRDAEKSLCWLRGWVSSDRVSDEFQAMQRYSQRYKSCHACITLNLKCTHPLPTWTEKLGELKRKQTLKPFFIVMALFFIAAFSGILGMMPFQVQIFKAYESPMAPDQATALVNVVNNLANLTFLLLIRFTGKRNLYLILLAMVFLCSAVVCGYGFAFLPIGYNSFDELQTFSLENKGLSYIPFVCIILWNFCTFCVIHSMPWQMVSEVFPYKTRGMATGLTAALNYLLSFVATKTYYNLETSLSMPGVALFNCFIIAIGFVLMYFILPETEGKTLEDIELHFADKSKRLTDRQIRKMSKQLGTEKDYDHIEEIIKLHAKNGCVNGGYTSGSN